MNSASTRLRAAEVAGGKQFAHPADADVDPQRVAGKAEQRHRPASPKSSNEAAGPARAARSRNGAAAPRSARIS